MGAKQSETSDREYCGVVQHIYIVYIYIVGQSHSSTLLGDFLSSKPVTEDPELATSGWGYPCALLRQ